MIGVENLPFVQIHQGKADQVVPPAQSEELMTLLDKAHKKKNLDYFYYEYAGEGHGFRAQKNIADSTSLTISFLQKHLG